MLHFSIVMEEEFMEEEDIVEAAFAREGIATYQAPPALVPMHDINLFIKTAVRRERRARGGLPRVLQRQHTPVYHVRRVCFLFLFLTV